MPPDLDEWIAADHPARFFSETIYGLDVAHLHETKPDGRPHYDRRMLLKVLLWSYVNAIRASRKIEERPQTDTTNMWLAALKEPDLHTICRFRLLDLEVLEELAVQMIGIAREMGMLQLDWSPWTAPRSAPTPGWRASRRAKTGKPLGAGQTGSPAHPGRG